MKKVPSLKSTKPALGWVNGRDLKSLQGQAGTKREVG